MQLLFITTAITTTTLLIGYHHHDDFFLLGLLLLLLLLVLLLLLLLLTTVMVLAITIWGCYGMSIHGSTVCRRRCVEKLCSTAAGSNCCNQIFSESFIRSRAVLSFSGSSARQKPSSDFRGKTLASLPLILRTVSCFYAGFSSFSAVAPDQSRDMQLPKQ